VTLFHDLSYFHFYHFITFCVFAFSCFSDFRHLRIFMFFDISPLLCLRPYYGVKYPFFVFCDIGGSMMIMCGGSPLFFSPVYYTGEEEIMCGGSPLCYV